MVVYYIVFELGDIVFGMNFLYGGYLIYGSLVNFSGVLYNFVEYGVCEDMKEIDYDIVCEVVLKYKLKMIVVGVSVYLCKIDFVKFCEIVDEVGVYLMVDMVYIVGFVVVGLY